MGTGRLLAAWCAALSVIASGCSAGKLYDAPAAAANAGDPPPPAAVRVQVSPPTTTVGYAATAQFTATVTGPTDRSVSWEMQEPSGCGTVDSAGLYTAPSVDATCHVVARSNADRTKSDVATVTVSSTGHLFLGGYFPIGVFMQNADTFDKWRGRGVNMLMGEPNWSIAGMTHDDSVRYWDREAAARGMRTIRRALSSPADDIGNTTLLAWAQDDEPDASGQGPFNITAMVSNYERLKAVDPSRPVYLNFAGPDVILAAGGATDPLPAWCTRQSGGCTTVANHIDYINRALDWVSNDLYPYTGWLPTESRRQDPTYVGDPIDRLRSWTSKPEFNFIETSNQYFVATGTGVTPGGLRAEIWISIIHGVRGYVFFPQVVAAVGGTASTDGTPPDVAAEMTVQNRIVTQLAATLQGAINPDTLSATVPAPMQVGWRDTPAAAYFFVVNPQNATVSSANITLTGVGSAATATVFNESRSVPLSSGTLTDSFGPYAVHIYVVPK